MIAAGEKFTFPAFLNLLLFALIIFYLSLRAAGRCWRFTPLWFALSWDWKITVARGHFQSYGCQQIGLNDNVFKVKLGELVWPWAWGTDARKCIHCSDFLFSFTPIYSLSNQSGITIQRPCFNIYCVNKSKIQWPSSAAVLSRLGVCFQAYCCIRSEPLGYTDSCCLLWSNRPIHFKKVVAVARGDSCKLLPPPRLCCWR